MIIWKIIYGILVGYGLYSLGDLYWDYDPNVWAGIISGILGLFLTIYITKEEK